MIKHVIFDLGGVLLDLDMPRSMAAFKALQADMSTLLQPASQTSADGRASATLCDGLAACGVMDLYQTGDVSTQHFLSEIQSHCCPGTTVEQVLQAWNDCLLSIPEYKLEYLLQLRSRGYQVHLLSNTNEAHWLRIAEDCFQGHPEKYFDTLFLSQEMHMAKPNSDIFQAVLSQLQSSPRECLFIDDTQDNVYAAAALQYYTYKAPLRCDFRQQIDALLSAVNTTGALYPQMTHSITPCVSMSDTATVLGSGNLPVLATPMMVAWMENAAMHCAMPLQTHEETTVGSHIAVSHLRPTAEGIQVTVTATLVERDGRKLTFRVEAADPQGKIGEGEHIRYIVDKEKFMSKL